MRRDSVERKKSAISLVVFVGKTLNGMPQALRDYADNWLEAY